MITLNAQPVVVMWRDSHTQAGIVEPSEHGDYVMRSVGFQVSEDELYLRIAQTLCEEGTGELLSIPVSCVLTKTWLGAREEESS
jgi:hypothetical protein